MKKLLTLAMFAIVFSSNLFAATDPNTRSLAHLAATYANATDVSWKSAGDFDKATFYQGADRIEVFYDVRGNFVGSFKTFAYDKLPKAALNTLGTDYSFPVYQLTDCVEFTDADNNTLYYVSMRAGNENIFLEISASGGVNEVASTLED